MLEETETMQELQESQHIYNENTYDDYKKGPIDKIYFLLDKILEFLLFIAVLAMLFIGLWQVVSRYILKISQPWSEELLRFIYVLITYGACGLCIKKGSYISIAFIFDKISSISKLSKKIMYVIIAGCEITFFGLMVVLGWQFAMNNMTAYSTANHINLGLLYMIFPFGGITGILYSLNNTRIFFLNQSEKGGAK